MRPLRLNQRIALGVAALLFMMSVVGGLGAYFVDRAADGTAELYRHAYMANQSLAEIRGRVLDIKVILLRQMAHSGDMDPALWGHDIHRHQGIIEENLAIAAAKGGWDDQALRDDWRDLSTYTDKAVIALLGGDTAGAKADFDRHGDWLFQHIDASLVDAIVAANAQASESVGKTETLSHNLYQSIIAMVAAALLLGGAIATGLTLSVAVPLGRLRAAIGNLSDNTPSPAVLELARDDEIGDIARALEQLRTETITRQNTQLQFRLIFQASPDIVTITERDSGRYLDVNAGFERILGYGRDEVIGRTSLELGIWASPEHRAKLVTALISDGNLVNFPSRGRRKNGELFDALISAEQFRVGDKDCMIFVVRDITTLNRQEELLRQSLAELERSNRELEHFAHIAAHDLQEPCRTLCSFAQLLARSDGPRLSADGKEYLSFLRKGALRMRDQIQGLLDYSRVSASPEPFVPVALEAVLDWVMEKHQAIFHDARATLHHDVLPTVSGNPGQLRQLLSNLISNSLKFQPHGQTPEITVTATRRNGLWEIAVADNGIGIDPQYQDTVFDLFRRLHGASHYPGNGLGLTIAKRIVERHGGTIWLDCHHGPGTTIRFTLPATGQ